MRPVSLTVVVTTLLFCSATWVSAKPVSLNLLGRSQAGLYTLIPSEDESRWLRNKGTLVLGTSAPDYAPFDISTGSDYYEGISADYAGLLSQLLKIEIHVNRYSTRLEAIEALKKGEIDMLATSNAYEQEAPQLTFSTRYVIDTPLLVRRIDKPDISGPEGGRLAMLYHYQPVDRVKKIYPNAQLQLYESTLGALSAVTFGQADAYLGDMISTHNLINKNYLNTVYFKALANLDVQGFHFAMLKSNTPLLGLVNSSLALIPESEANAILSRWGVSGIPDTHVQTLEFTQAEQRWIENNPRLKVAVTDDFLPFTFFDEQGAFNGLAADLLERISLSTGLKFEVISVPSVSALVASVTEGKADLMAAITPSNRRLDNLRITKPYLSTPYVLINRKQRHVGATLEQLKGKRVAVIPDGSMATFLAEHHPEVKFVYAQNAAQMLDLLAHGKVEAAITPLISARYLI